jgi:hypothetical protein
MWKNMIVTTHSYFCCIFDHAFTLLRIVVFVFKTTIMGGNTKQEIENIDIGC